MPLEEGHWQRSNTPLRRLTRRERNVVLVGLTVTAAVLVVLVLATAGDSRSGPAPGCIRALVPGRTGGEIVAACGAEAKAACARSTRFDDPRSRSIADSCREAGIEAVAAPPDAAATG